VIIFALARDSNAVTFDGAIAMNEHPIPADDERTLRILLALPVTAHCDREFVAQVYQIVAQCDPHNALQEQALARIVCGMWRMKPMLAAENHELDPRALAEAERSQARAEASWARLRRLEMAENRQRKRAANAPRKDEPNTDPATAAVDSPSPSLEPEHHASPEPQAVATEPCGQPPAQENAQQPSTQAANQEHPAEPAIALIPPHTPPNSFELRGEFPPFSPADCTCCISQLDAP
jgi:hypothetical protein